MAPALIVVALLALARSHEQSPLDGLVELLDEQQETAALSAYPGSPRRDSGMGLLQMEPEEGRLNYSELSAPVVQRLPLSVGELLRSMGEARYDHTLDEKPAVILGRVGQEPLQPQPEALPLHRTLTPEQLAHMLHMVGINDPSVHEQLSLQSNRMQQQKEQQEQQKEDEIEEMQEQLQSTQAQVEQLEQQQLAPKRSANPVPLDMLLGSMGATNYDHSETQQFWKKVHPVEAQKDVPKAGPPELSPTRIKFVLEQLGYNPETVDKAVASLMNKKEEPLPSRVVATAHTQAAVQGVVAAPPAPPAQLKSEDPAAPPTSAAAAKLPEGPRPSQQDMMYAQEKKETEEAAEAEAKPKVDENVLKALGDESGGNAFKRDDVHKHGAHKKVDSSHLKLAEDAPHDITPTPFFADGEYGSEKKLLRRDSENPFAPPELELLSDQQHHGKNSKPHATKKVEGPVVDTVVDLDPSVDAGAGAGAGAGARQDDMDREVMDEIAKAEELAASETAQQEQQEQMVEEPQQEADEPQQEAGDAAVPLAAAVDPVIEQHPQPAEQAGASTMAPVETAPAKEESGKLKASGTVAAAAEAPTLPGVGGFELTAKSIFALVVVSLFIGIAFSAMALALCKQRHIAALLTHLKCYKVSGRGKRKKTISYAGKNRMYD